MSTPDPEPVDPNEVRPGPIRKFETKVEEAVAVLWRRPKFIVGACATLVAALLWTGWALRFEEEQSIERVLPGEFEHHDLLVVAWPTDSTADKLRLAHRQVVDDIVSAVQDDIQVAVLTTDDQHRKDAASFLLASESPENRLRFLQAPSESIWVRDYGPLVAKSFNGGYEVVNTVHPHPILDDVPLALRGQLGLPSIDAPIVMENGGDLLSNGAGLCVTTERLVIINGRGRSHVTELLREYMGAEQVVYLENMIGEVTGHVDVFVTFTAPDTVVVGQYARTFDPKNAAILDRNARRLAKVRTARGPLKVYRIVMPRRFNSRWPTFTNVVYANGVLLLPTYGTRYREHTTQASALYRKLLPKWKIVGVDCSDLIEGDGALHCVTMNVYRIASQGSSNSRPATTDGL